MSEELFRDDSGLEPPLPARVPCVSLWQPYAELVIAGVKTIETRTWPWPYAPGWLAIHEAKHVDREAERRLAKRIAKTRDDLCSWGPARGGSVIGLVYVAGCRGLIEEDEADACFYAPNRHAWLLVKPTPFARPIVMRGPQKFVFLPRARIVDALKVTL